jgi:uncharacterized protein
MHNRDDILALLQQHRHIVAQRFNATDIALFGSAARDDMGPDGDVDVLVGFNGPATYDAYFALKDDLEKVLGRPVDLVTQKGLKPRARLHVERDLIGVAQPAAELGGFDRPSLLCAGPRHHLGSGSQTCASPAAGGSRMASTL